MNFLQSALYVLAVLFILIWLSTKLAETKYGKQFGAAILVIILGAIAANLGIIPSASNSIDLYSFIFNYIAPVSIFYLMLGVNLKKLKEAGLPMIVLFVLGSAGTVIGTLTAFYLIQPEESLGQHAKSIAGMITGTYSGGSINFNAVALHYKVTEAGIIYAGTVAVDNVLTTVWMLVTLAIPKFMHSLWKGKQIGVKEKKVEQNKQVKSMGFRELSLLAALGVTTLFISQFISTIWPQLPSIITLTTIGLILAQIKYIHNLKGSQQIGLYLVYLFLAVVGAYCEISAIHELGSIGLTLLAFLGVTILIHGIITVGIGRLLFSDWDMIAIASQANIGGSTTAMAMAESSGRNDLILPAILVGTLGNALGTYLGFMVAGIL